MIINLIGDNEDTIFRLLKSLNLRKDEDLIFFDCSDDMVKHFTKCRTIQTDKNTDTALSLLKNELALFPGKQIVLNNADYLNNEPADTVLFFTFSEELIKHSLILIISKESLVISNDNIAYYRIRTNNELASVSFIINKKIREFIHI